MKRGEGLKKYIVPAIAAGLLAFLLIAATRASPDVFRTAGRNGRWI